MDANPGVSIAGFIVNEHLEMKPEVKEKMEEISITTGTDIRLFTFKEWVSFKLSEVPASEWDSFAQSWLKAVVESFARKRLDIAPIDEPCDDWLLDLVKALD